MMFNLFINMCYAVGIVFGAFIIVCLIALMWSIISSVFSFKKKEK